MQNNSLESCHSVYAGFRWRLARQCQWIGKLARSIARHEAAALGSLLLLSMTAAAADPPLAHQYGFLPPEIYKLDYRIANLLIRDVRGDGVPAVVVVNNANNRIDILEQRKSDDPPEDFEVNELPNDQRMSLRKISVPRSVGSLEVRDVNSDNLPDLVYLGDPPGLFIEYQQKDGSFQRGRSFDIDDAQTSVWSVDVADLNGDGRNDIALLGKNNLYIVYQDENGRLKEPAEFRLSEGKANLLRLLDLNEDGATDVVYLSDDQQFPVRVRFQNKQGGLGPERRYAIDPPRGVTYANIDGKPGQEMLMVSNLSGRLLVYTLDKQTKDKELPYQLVTYPFEKSGSAPQTDMAVADFDGDGYSDVVVGDSESARLVLYRHNEANELGLGTSYPSMLGASLLRAVDTDGDGKSELLILSGSERAIGLSRFDGTRLSFPESLPTRDEPVAMDLLEGDQVQLAYIVRIQDANSRKDRFMLRGLQLDRSEDSTNWKPMKFNDKEEIELQLQTKPLNMQAADVNFDGHPDLMLFFLFQPPVLLMNDGNGGFEQPKSYVLTSLGTVSAAAVYSGPLLDNEKALLIGQSNFARNMQLDPNLRWRVKDQYNASESSANVTGVVALDADADGEREIAMYDRTSSSVVMLKRRDGLFRRWKTIKVGAFDLRGIRAVDFDKDKHEDLLLFDTDKMSIIYNGKSDAELKQIASYETDLRRGRLFDVAAGDLNGDNRPDLLVLEPVEHNLDILHVDANTNLKRATRWQVFEEKTFSRSSLSGGLEPREMVIGDVNSDGLNDIVLIAHNRVLIYLQDDGQTEPPAPAANAAAGN